jgi:lipopolysaccharide transport system permease protein
MLAYSLSPREMVASPWRHRKLIGMLVRREVVGRYRGSVLGILWSFFNPVVMLLVYTFVFGVVFKARWTAQSQGTMEFALLLFAGLIVFNVFSECINRAPTLVLSNVNYVKKVAFPLEILPWVALGSALFHGLISVLVWVLAYIIAFGTPQPTVLVFPFVILSVVLFTVGLSWGLASLGVYLRDVSQFIGMVTMAMMFLSPIFYPVSALPPAWQPLLLANPLTAPVEQMREVLFWGRWPDLGILVQYLAGSAVVAWLGFAWFQKTRKGFSDVL